MSERLTLDEKVFCAHCGEECDDDEIRIQEEHFCCLGCKAVFELLKDPQLNVHFEKSRARKNSSSLGQTQYDFLDEDSFQEKLIRFKDERQSQVVFSLPGIHCSSCIYLLEHLNKMAPAVLSSKVNFPTKTVSITFDHKSLSLKSLASLLAHLGYPPNISLSNEDNAGRSKKKNNLAVKIAVAGFCFGNAMLMSMPEYLDHNFLLSDDFKSIFSWINLALAFPVVLFSGQDYFQRAWVGIKHNTLNIDVPISLGILTLFIRSLYEIISQTGMGYVDSLSGLVFLLLIGKWYQGKTYSALSFERDYKSYFPVSVTCLEGGNEVPKAISELRKNDLVVIHNNELIPADGQLVEGACRLDYSFVSGEVDPRLVNVGEKVFAGGRQKGPQIVVKLSHEVRTSELVSLWNNNVFKKGRPMLHLWVDRISKYFTAVVLLVALLTGLYWWISNPAIVWNAVTAVLIIACPCALALVLPFTYGHALRIFGRHGLYLKNAEVISELSEIKEIVFDKTGTLTEPISTVRFHGIDLTEIEQILLRSALDNSSHPLSRQILLDLPNFAKVPIDAFEEIIGKGFFSQIGDHVIKVGSAEWVGAASLNYGESNVHIFVDGYKGYFTMSSSYRPEIFETVSSLRPQYKTHVLSGDNANQKPILSPYFDELAFEKRPKEKLEYIGAHTSNALMVGDGLNDAGALKSARVGLAVAENIHQFSPACDGIISADRLVSLPLFLQLLKRTKAIIFVAFGLSFLYNIVGLYFAITGQLTPLISAVLMPISSVTVVGFVTLAVIYFGRPLSDHKPSENKSRT